MLVTERQYVKFLLDNDVKYYPSHNCGCGCNGFIEVQNDHRWYKIPTYIFGHAIKVRPKELRDKIHKKLKGQKRSEQHKRLIKLNNAKYWKGKKNPEHSKRMSGDGNPKVWLGKKRPDMVGELNPAWKGGRPTPRELDIEYFNWRTSIYKRDDYTCQKCKQKGGSLNAHHILKYADYPQHELKMWNGITLCLECHKQTYYKEYAFVLEFLAYTGSIMEIRYGNL